VDRVPGGSPRPLARVQGQDSRPRLPTATRTPEAGSGEPHVRAMGEEPGAWHRTGPRSAKAATGVRQVIVVEIALRIPYTLKSGTISALMTFPKAIGQLLLQSSPQVAGGKGPACATGISLLPLR
jgi:hypothetical protein